MARREVCAVWQCIEVENVEHFLIKSDEFQWEREKLLERCGEAKDVGDWIEAFHRAGKEERPALLASTSC